MKRYTHVKSWGVYLPTKSKLYWDNKTKEHVAFFKGKRIHTKMGVYYIGEAIEKLRKHKSPKIDGAHHIKRIKRKLGW